jgi:hypothetical protein
VTWKAAAVVLAFLALQAWVLFGKRSGEVAFAPPAGERTWSLEVAGEVGLEQSFVPGADGLDGITVQAKAVGPPPPGTAELALEATDLPVPIRTAVPAAALVAGERWTWGLPRVEASAGRRFTLHVRLPQAGRGEGVTFAIGPPRYALGDLRVGGRQQWGDLVFATHAHRARTIDTLRALPLPGALGRDLTLTAAILLLDGALAAVALALLGGPSVARRVRDAPRSGVPAA